MKLEPDGFAGEQAAQQPGPSDCVASLITVRKCLVYCRTRLTMFSARLWSC